MSTLGRIARATGNWIPAVLARPFGAPTAVFFHGVEPQIADPRIQINQHRLDAFEDMARLMKRDFDVLPLDALPDVLKHPDRHRRTLFLMSDDGYANALTVAADILAAFALPWTLFVSTHHIDTGDLNPMTVARAFFTLAPEGRYEIPHFHGLTLGAEREALAKSASARLKSLNAAQAGEAVGAMNAALAGAGIDVGQRFASEHFLTWPQIGELHRRGVEIGAHADWHWPMHARQSAEYLREQAIRPKQRIEQEVGPCRAFAYPFGHRDDVCRAAWEAVRDARYDHAFTTLSGTLNAGTNPWLLPRYGLASEESNLSAVFPVLRTNNAKLRQWQSRIGT